METPTVVKRFILVPVAIPGSGKTTLAKALHSLYPSWGFFQNDLVKGKGPKAVLLMRQCTDFLKVPAADTKDSHENLSGSVVFVDRNNHLYSHRHGIMTAINDGLNGLTEKETDKKITYDLTYICLNFVPNLRQTLDPKNQLKQAKDLNLKRIFARGDSHPTIRAATRDKNKLYGIMGMFVKQFQSVDVKRDPDSGFDLVIDLDSTSTDSTRKNLRTVINKLREKYNDELISEAVSDEQLDEVFQIALQQDVQPSTTETSELVKHALLPDEDLRALIDQFLATQNQETEALTAARTLWEKLKSEKKVLQHFQVFLSRKKGSTESDKDMASSKRRKLDIEKLDVLTIKSLVFTDKLIALNVEYTFQHEPIIVKTATLVIASEDLKSQNQELAKLKTTSDVQTKLQWNITPSTLTMEPHNFINT